MVFLPLSLYNDITTNKKAMKLQRIENRLDCRLQINAMEQSLNAKFFDATPKFTKSAFGESTSEVALI